MLWSFVIIDFCLISPPNNVKNTSRKSFYLYGVFEVIQTQIHSYLDSSDKLKELHSRWSEHGKVEDTPGEKMNLF